MNQRISHKEFILLLGVVVALLVIFLLWFSQMPTAQSAELGKTEIVPHILSLLNDGFLKKTMIELSRVVEGY